MIITSLDLRRPFGTIAVLVASCVISAVVWPEVATAQGRVFYVIRREQRSIDYQDPPAAPSARIPDIANPPTVSNPQWEGNIKAMGLDEAIRLTMANSKVIRVLAGTTATSSGSTIYDPAITNTTIDQALGRFDPTVDLKNTFSRNNPAMAAHDPLDPSRAVIGAIPTQGYDMNLGVSQTNPLGGTAKLGVDVNPSQTRAPLLPLNPQTRSSLELSYTQPLLQGAGIRANMAPIVIARLNTERSYFQFKDNVQQSVRSVIQAYWSLVFARTDAWARRRQVEQGESALRRAEARLQLGQANLADVAQAKTALANFKATLIASEANILNQEAALANLMELDPTLHPIPMSPPTTDRLTVRWDEIVKLAELHRPDLIELRLILEADREAVYQASNQAKPKLDAVATYRWNGLEGTMPNRAELDRFGGSLNEWAFGINFSVPIGMRQSRAALRQQELITMRDQANLDQGIHNASHSLAIHVRNLAQYYDQYQAYHEARIAARANLDLQLANYQVGRTILLNVLTAITAWGDSVSAESQTLTLYNTELATLEVETGTILETHGIRFLEERFGSVGPLGRIGHKRDYPSATVPGPNAEKYPVKDKPAENTFELEDPLKPKAVSPQNK